SGQKSVAGTQPRSPTPASSVSPNVPVTTIVHPPTSRARPQSVHATATTSAMEMITTTMIPIRGLDGDDVFSPAPRTPKTGTRTIPLTMPDATVRGDEKLVPGTPVNRQEALRQIRERRDRARSVHLKPSSGN